MRKFLIWFGVVLFLATICTMAVDMFRGTQEEAAERDSAWLQDREGAERTENREAEEDCNRGFDTCDDPYPAVPPPDDEEGQ